LYSLSIGCQPNAVKLLQDVLVYEFKRSQVLVSVSLEDRQNMTAQNLATLNQRMMEARTALIDRRSLPRQRKSNTYLFCDSSTRIR